MFAAAVTLIISGMPASVQAGQPAVFVLRALDAHGAQAKDYDGTVSFDANFPGTALPASYTFTAGDEGAHEFAIVPTRAGAQLVTAFDAHGLAATATTLCTPAPASQYAFTDAPELVAPGAAASFALAAYDPFWNVATSYEGVARVASSDRGAILPAAIFKRGAASLRIVFRTPGSHWITASDTAAPSISATAWATAKGAVTASR